MPSFIRTLDQTFTSQFALLKMKKLIPVVLLTMASVIGLFADDAVGTAVPAMPPSSAPRRMVVLRPKVSSNLDASLQEALWHALEDAVAHVASGSGTNGQPAFVLLNRNAVAETLTETEFQGTHLVAVGGEKIVPGEVQSASLLLNTAVSKFDEKTWFLSMSLLNGTTLEVIPGYQFQDTYETVRDLLDKLQYNVSVLLGHRKIKDVAILYPAGLAVLGKPEDSQRGGEVFLSKLRVAMVRQLNVAALEEVRGALRQMNLSSTSELTERDWMRMGTLLGARYLVVPMFTTSKVSTKLVSYEGESYPFAQLEFNCSLKVIEVKQGRTAAEIELTPIRIETKGEFGMSVAEYEEKIVPTEVSKSLEALASEASRKLQETWKEFASLEE